jgi:TetR/AcrR family transcriptional repressor of nem operon
LETAERLVERNGFAATSVDAILAESGSSKGAFFHHFASKRDLASALVERYVDADLGMLRRGLEAAESESEPVAKLVAFLNFYETWSGDLTSESACLYIAVISERDLLDDAAGAHIERAILGWRTAVADLIRKAYAARGLVDGPDADDLADQLFVVFEGSYLMCRALGSGAPMRAQLRVFRQLVESLLA